MLPKKRMAKKKSNFQMVCKFQIFCTKGWIKVYLKVNKTINYHATRLKVLIYDQDYKLDNLL